MASSSSSTSRTMRLRAGSVGDVHNLPDCDCDKPSMQRTLWRIGNPGRRFFNCRNSMTKLTKCNFFEWIDDELEDGYYKTLIYLMKQKLDSREDHSELHKYRTKVVELEFLLSKEKAEVERLQKLMDQSNKVAGRLKLVIVVLVVVVLFLWLLWK